VALTLDRRDDLEEVAPGWSRGLGGRPTPLTSIDTDARQVGEDAHKVWWVVRSTVSAQVRPRTRIVASLPTLASSRSGECGDGLDEPDADDCELGE
jgi:hypothetical protein